MVYKKRYYKRRYYKRRNPLRKGNIFSKKSAKSQAKQIYALNKKINRIEWKTKPEITTLSCSLLQKPENRQPVKTWNDKFALIEQGLLGAGHLNYQIHGSMLRMQDITVYGQISNEMFNYINSSLGNAVSDVPLTGYLRIVVVKFNQNAQNLPPTVFKPFTEGVADMGLINGPLVSGVSSCFKIVKDKVVKINAANPSKFFRIKIRNAGTYRIAPHNPAQTTPFYKNDYMLYMQYYCPTQLVIGASTVVGPIQFTSLSVKYAFVDE